MEEDQNDNRDSDFDYLSCPEEEGDEDEDEVVFRNQGKVTLIRGYLESNFR